MQTARQRIVQLVVAMLVAAAARPALASVTIDIGAATAHPSGSAQVPITMAGAPDDLDPKKNVAGLEFDIQLPAVLAVSDPATACALAPNVHGAVSSSLVGGRLKLILIDFGGGSYTTNGLLMTCTFSVAAGAANDTYPLTGTGLVVDDHYSYAFDATLDSGAVKVCTGCCP
jgi:hypothetical protein